MELYNILHNQTLCTAYFLTHLLLPPMGPQVLIAPQSLAVGYWRGSVGMLWDHSLCQSLVAAVVAAVEVVLYVLTLVSSVPSHVSSGEAPHPAASTDGFAAARVHPAAADPEGAVVVVVGSHSLVVGSGNLGWEPVAAEPLCVEAAAVASL